MKNYSLVILLWIASTTFAMSNVLGNDIHNPETVAVLSTKKLRPDENVHFQFISNKKGIYITNASPINEIRVYDNNGKLIDTLSHIYKNYSYDTSKLEPGKYAFNIQVADEVVTHIFKKE